MKRTYVRPTAVVETFTANEYVAACGMKDGKYIFTCDAPEGTVHITYNKTDYKLGGYHPCGATHVTTGPDGYFDGWVDYNDNKKKDNGEDALIWVEGFNKYLPSYSDNWHASKSLTRDKIQEERS